MASTPLNKPDESDLFIASNISSLEDFLKTNISNHKHAYCCFPLSEICYIHYQEFKKRQLHSVSFQNGRTLYPPFEPRG
ncbi:hypothetical protein [Vibrio harveyi]|uniref:hypothetical protein n=1 Tax=Vibrio harveyi TaxID=669 RepID=UPI0030F6F481